MTIFEQIFKKKTLLQEIEVEINEKCTYQEKKIKSPCPGLTNSHRT